MRRHARKSDPYQKFENFIGLFEQIKAAIYPSGVENEDFKKLIYAAQYRERFPAKVSKSGRRAKFDDTFLFNSAGKIKSVLEKETGGRISLARFASAYLPILNYPRDLQAALGDYRINLEEAGILARINRKNLGEAVKRKPSEIRREIIDSHVKRRGTQAELNNRVNQRLNISPKRQAAGVAATVAAIDLNVDELLEFNEFDTEHLLWEEIKSLVYLMREVDSSQVDDETTEQILKDLDSIKLRLMKFRKIETE